MYQTDDIVVKIDLKTDQNGNTAPIVTDCNNLITSINKPSYQCFEAAMTARKTLLLSKTKMGSPRKF